MKDNSYQKVLYSFLALAFLTRFGLFLIFQPWVPKMRDEVILLYDAIGYNNLAKILMETFSMKTEILRTPIYPSFIATIYTIFGIKPFVVLFAQIFVSVATAYFFYRFVEYLTNTRIAQISLFIFAIEPTLILYTSFLYSEVLFMFFTMLSLFWIMKGLKNSQNKWFIFSGIALGLATLTRPAGQYLIIIYITIVLFYTIPKNLKIKYAAILTVFYLLSIFPWAMRNKIFYDRFILSNTMDHNALILSSFYTEFQNSSLHRDSIINGFLKQVKEAAPNNLKDEMPTNLKELNKRQSFEHTDVFAIVAKKYLMSHKKEFLLAQLRGAINLHINMGTEQFMLRLHQETKRWDIKDKVGLGTFTMAKKFFATKTTVEISLGLFILLLLGIIYLFATVGIYVAIKKRNFYLLIVCLLNIAYYVALSSIYPTPRFRNPFMPFYILLASYGAFYLSQNLFRRNYVNMNNS